MKHLTRTAAPLNCTDDLPGAPGRQPPISWAEVRALASRAIEELISTEGVDARGWLDADCLSPAPADPDGMLARVAATCARLERQLNQSGAVNAEVAASLADAAKRLRWLRTYVADELSWGKAIGSLRRMVAHHPAGLELVAILIDPVHRPEATWAAAVGDRPGSIRPGPVVGISPGAAV
jgi:hypothetical protein